MQLSSYIIFNLFVISAVIYGCGTGLYLILDPGIILEHFNIFSFRFDFSEAALPIFKEVVPKSFCRKKIVNGQLNKR